MKKFEISVANTHVSITRLGINVDTESGNRLSISEYILQELGTDYTDFFGTVKVTIEKYKMDTKENIINEFSNEGETTKVSEHFPEEDINI